MHFYFTANFIWAFLKIILEGKALGGLHQLFGEFDVKNVWLPGLAILAIPWIFLKRHRDVGSIGVLFFYVDDSAATERTGNELVDINVYVEN